MSKKAWLLIGGVVLVGYYYFDRLRRVVMGLQFSIIKSGITIDLARTNGQQIGLIIPVRVVNNSDMTLSFDAVKGSFTDAYYQPIINFDYTTVLGINIMPGTNTLYVPVQIPFSALRDSALNVAVQWATTGSPGTLGFVGDFKIAGVTVPITTQFNIAGPGTVKQMYAVSEEQPGVYGFSNY